MGQMRMDWGLFTEAKVTKGIQTRFSSDYHVVCTEANSSSQGGLALFFKDSTAFQVEAVRRHGPNCISFELVVAGVRRPVIGAYIPPSDTALHSLEYILQAFEFRPSIPTDAMGGGHCDRNSVARASRHATNV
jgi:hypothetical protein